MKNRNRAILAFAGVAALCLISAATAMAARVVGDGGSNTLTGTDQRDRIVAKAGDDTIDAADAQRVLDGVAAFGPTLYGPGVCADPVAVPPDADATTRMLAAVGRRA